MHNLSNIPLGFCCNIPPIHPPPNVSARRATPQSIVKWGRALSTPYRLCQRKGNKNARELSINPRICGNEIRLEHSHIQISGMLCLFCYFEISSHSIQGCARETQQMMMMASRLPRPRQRDTSSCAGESNYPSPTNRNNEKLETHADGRKHKHTHTHITSLPCTRIYGKHTRTHSGL